MVLHSFCYFYTKAVAPGLHRSPNHFDRIDRKNRPALNLEAIKEGFEKLENAYINTCIYLQICIWRSVWVVFHNFNTLYL